MTPEVNLSPGTAPGHEPVVILDRKLCIPSEVKTPEDYNRVIGDHKTGVIPMLREEAAQEVGSALEEMKELNISPEKLAELSADVRLCVTELAENIFQYSLLGLTGAQKEDFHLSGDNTPVAEALRDPKVFDRNARIRIEISGEHLIIQFEQPDEFPEFKEKWKRAKNGEPDPESEDCGMGLILLAKTFDATYSRSESGSTRTFAANLLRFGNAA